MLTPFADEPAIKEVGKKTGRWDVVSPEKFTDFIDLQPIKLIKFNITDDSGKSVNVPLTCNKNIVLPSNITIKIVANSNPYIEIAQTTVAVKNSKLTFDVEYKQSIQDLKNTLPERTRIPIHMELINKEEIQRDEGKIVSLTPNDIELELINKPEKTLRIHVQK
jgi:hypothetical protein